MRTPMFHAAAMRAATFLLTGALLTTGCAGTMSRRAPTDAGPTGDELADANELFLAGKMAEARESWGEAISAYMEALQFDPEADEIAYALATTFLHDGKFKSSRHFARLATELDDSQPDYWRLVQYLEEREGNYAGAAGALEHLLPLVPEQAVAGEIRLVQYYFALGRSKDARKILLDRAGDPHTTAEEMYEIASTLAFNDLSDDAVDVLEDLIARDPLEVDAWLYLGDLYSNLGDKNRALETYRKALETNAGDLFLLVTIGNQCLVNNDWGCAASYLEQAAALGPGQSEDAGIDYTDILRTLVSVYYYDGRDRDAEALFESLVGSGDDTASLYFSLGKAMTYLDQSDEAVRYYRTGFGKDLSDMSMDFRLRALSGYTVALVDNGQNDEALRIVREDGPVYASDTAALKSLEASIYMELERYDDAIPIYEWLSASDPGNRSYLYSLSLACDLGGRFDDAERALKTILDDDPGDALALNNLAYMYLEHNQNIEESLAMVRQALIIEPENGAYLDTLAWAYYKLGKYKEARREIERALTWAGEDDAGVIYEHYGDILTELGKPAEAADAYRSAIEHGEDEARINAKLDILDR